MVMRIHVADWNTMAFYLSDLFIEFLFNSADQFRGKRDLSYSVVLKAFIVSKKRA